MERKLRFLNNELEKADIEIRPASGVEAPDPQGKRCEEHRVELLLSEWQCKGEAFLWNFCVLLTGPFVPPIIFSSRLYSHLSVIAASFILKLRLVG